METAGNHSTGTSKFSSNNTIGDYVIEKRLGGGEHSSTLMGINKTTRETVAIKVFHKSSPLSESLYKSELRAYRTLRTMPGILQLKDEGENDEIYFIVTDFIQEGSLRHILEGYPEGMSIEDVIELFSPIADVIDSIHGKNIIDCDLRPENILVRKTGKDYKVFIMGFSAAKFTTDPQQFQTEQAVGTSWYIAPEAWKADPNIPQTKALDIYALGVMLYEALEAKIPFEDITEVLNDSAPPLEWAKHKTNSDIVACILKALNPDPRQRPASAREIIDSIENAHQGNLSKEKKWVGQSFKHYRVEGVLGTGRMGITLLAMDTRTSKRVVLKAFELSLFGTPPPANDNEIVSLERLENGHGIITPQETFEENDVLFIVTDYQSGGTLRQLLSKRPKLTIKEILEIFSQIAEAIDYIHENKIIHRDIKPENVVYNITDGKVITFLTDFGISVILASARSYFHTDQGVGFYRYMAPELWKPNAKKTRAVDIYAFGIMLYEALEGQVPFNAEYPGIMHQHISAPVPAAKKTFKDLGDKAHKILIQALAKEAEERPKTATEIIQQIKGHYTKFLGKKLGKYTIEKFIGRGAYGATYQAYDSSHKRKKFALKILSTPTPNVQDITELKGLGKDHGVLPILDSGSENDIHYIVTEYLNGNSLRDMLQDSSQGLRLEEALKIFKPVAKALDSIHSAGVIHGDLKPENIVFYKKKEGNSFQPLITDYAIFKVAGKTQTPYFKFNFSAGNIAYMAPEVWGEREPSGATDIYALGVMVYEALEGTLPFNKKSLIGMMRQHLNAEPPVPKNLLRLRGRNAVNALMQSLEKNPEHRQKSAGELVSQLESKALDRTPISLRHIAAPMITAFGSMSNFLKKKVELSLSFLIGLIASLIVIFALVWSSVRGNLPPAPPTTPSPFISSAPPITATIPTDISLSPTDSQTPPGNTAIPPSVLDRCAPKHVPAESGLPKDYVANRVISSEDLYEQFVAGKRDNMDLFAMVYYNNRRAAEDPSYQFIDPVRLTIERNSKVFLPSMLLVDQYRTYPIPVLERLDPGNTVTTINFSGNSALSALSQQIAECFEATHPDFDIQLESNSTASGLIDFCEGRANLFGTSEKITSQRASENGCSNIDLLEFEVARYAPVIFISDRNPYASELRESPPTKDELASLLFSAEVWGDVREDWGDEPISRYYPPVEGGVFEIVKNTVLQTLDTNPPIPNLDDKQGSLIPQKVAEDAFSIGFSGFADYQNQRGDLIAIPIEEILPNLETIQGDSPTYPLTHSLYLYTGQTTFNNNPLLRYFINYYLVYDLDFLDEPSYFRPNTNGLLNAQYYPKPK